MTFIGKILVFLIFVMSVTFMGLQMAVYTAQKNWKDVATRQQAGPGEPLGLVHQLKNKETEISALKTRLDQLDESFTAEKTALQQQLAKLNTEKERLLTENADLVTKRDELDKSYREQGGMVKSLQEELTRLTTEVGELRVDIRKSQEDRDTMFAEVSTKTDDLHKTNLDLKAAQERERQLVAQVQHYKAKLSDNNIEPDAPLANTPPQVDGLVTAVRGDKMIEVSIGADDGLRVGHTLEVYRSNTYLGRVEIVKTSPDKAAAKILSEFQRGPIQKGDRVATRLKVG